MRNVTTLSRSESVFVISESWKSGEGLCVVGVGAGALSTISARHWTSRPRDRGSILLVGRHTWCFQEQRWGGSGLSFEISPECESSWLLRGVCLSGLRDRDAKSPWGAVGAPPGGLSSSEQHLSCILQAPCGSGMNVSLCGALASRALEGATWHCTPQAPGQGFHFQHREQSLLLSFSQ